MIPAVIKAEIEAHVFSECRLLSAFIHMILQQCGLHATE